MKTAIFAASLLAFCLLPFISSTHAHANGATGSLLVINKNDSTLGIVDPEAGKQIAVIPVGGITGHEVAASPDGQTAWVPIYGDSGVGLPGTDGRTISVIDLASRKVTVTIDLGAPSRPHTAVFSAKNDKLYVTAEVTQSIKIIDPNSNKVVGSIPTGEPQSHMVAISSDGTRGYSMNAGSGTISALDLQKQELIKIIPVAKTIQRIAISTDNRLVFTSDQTKPELDIIDTQTNTVTSRLPLQNIGYGVTPTYDGSKLLIAHPSADTVSILDLHSMKIEKVIPVPKAPQEIVVRPDDQVVYVSCAGSKQIAVINLASLKVEKLIAVGTGPDGLAWAPAK
jgi:DNA-binding beta-propeller fold protein YncE